jgi:hypothetical protein
MEIRQHLKIAALTAMNAAIDHAHKGVWRIVGLGHHDRIQLFVAPRTLTVRIPNHCAARRPFNNETRAHVRSGDASNPAWAAPGRPKRVGPSSQAGSFQAQANDVPVELDGKSQKGVAGRLTKQAACSFG